VIKEIAHITVGLPVEGPFDYLISDPLMESIRIGHRVWVSFGTRKIVGYVVGFKDRSAIKRLKYIDSMIDQLPLITAQHLSLAREFSKYYGCSLGEAIETGLPSLLRKGRPVDLSADQSSVEQPNASSEISLAHDPGRQTAWKDIEKAIKSALDAQQGVLILVPEASLINDVLSRMSVGVPQEKVAVLSGLTDKKELELWQQVREGKLRMAVGVISAIFAPVRNLGLIVMIDEESTLYQHEQTPFYHSRQVAMMRARVEKCSVVFLSAAPSVELFAKAHGKNIQYRLAGSSSSCAVQLIDSTNFRSSFGFIYPPLRSRMEQFLKGSGKILLFYNRRGFYTMTRCLNCGYVLKCQRCDVFLNFSGASKELQCHRCNFKEPLPTQCPQCCNPGLKQQGTGIEKLKEEIKRSFPQARVALVDRENTAFPVSFDVLVATQAVLRWIDHLKVHVTGVIDVDSEFNRLDFRSAQRTYALLAHLKIMTLHFLMIQTQHPDNYCLKAVLKNKPADFYKREMKLRKELGLPPFKHWLSIYLRGPNQMVVSEQAKELYNLLTAKPLAVLLIHEPHTDVVTKLRDQYRFIIRMQGKDIVRMMKYFKKSLRGLKKKSGVIVTVKVDG